MELTALIICSFATYGLTSWLNFKREERKHVNTVALSDRLEAELEEIKKLKPKIDALTLQAGIRVK